MSKAIPTELNELNERHVVNIAKWARQCRHRGVSQDCHVYEALETFFEKRHPPGLPTQGEPWRTYVPVYFGQGLHRENGLLGKKDCANKRSLRAVCHAVHGGKETIRFKSVGPFHRKDEAKKTEKKRKTT
eukprot:1157743-Pelagomonas_calceolata.AAC.1